MTSSAAQKTIQKKVVVAACFGTFLEWYDFLTFASLATYFGVLFFPSDDPVAALLASLGTFGVGMIVRPLGAALFGSLGDRHGRRTIFLVTIVVMGLATALVGVLPTYASIGFWAPVILVVLRLAQQLPVQTHACHRQQNQHGCHHLSNRQPMPKHQPIGKHRHQWVHK